MQDLRQELRDLIVGMGQSHPDQAARATELLDLLLPVRLEAASSKRGEAEVEYSVEASVNGLVLNERRNGRKAHPLRCPAKVYDAMVAVLSKSGRAVPLDELVSAVAEVLGDAPADYQVRVPLRLWMQVDPPLLSRNRARYRPVDAARFASEATKLWVALRGR